jgi:hypothetical protein
MSSAPQTHDFSDRNLEKEFHFRPCPDGKPGSLVGLLTPSDPKIQVGDILLIPRNGNPSQFQVTQVFYSCHVDIGYKYEWCSDIEIISRSEPEPLTWRQLPPML